MERVNFSHSNAIIITTNVGMKVRHHLVDNGSSSDILFLEAFMEIGIKLRNLKPSSRGLLEFTGPEAPNVVTRMLLFTLGKWPKSTT